MYCASDAFTFISLSTSTIYVFGVHRTVFVYISFPTEFRVFSFGLLPIITVDSHVLFI